MNETRIDELLGSKKMFSIIVIGNHKVGKSSFVNQLSGKGFEDNQEVTLGVEYTLSEIIISGRLMRFRLADFAGQDNFAVFRTNYMKNMDLAIMVFDLTSKSTLEKLVSWADDLKSANTRCIPILLLGNKLDLAENRDVKIQDVRQFMHLMKSNSDNQYEIIDYIETSAKTGDNIDACINRIVSLLSEF